MKALVIGDGGQAHALAWKLVQSPAVSALYTAPGNYGTNLAGANVHIDPTEPEELAAWAKETGIDLTVVGSRAALAYGVVDVFRERGLRITGPTRAAARLETDHAWARAFMDRHQIPSGAWRACSDEHPLGPEALRDMAFPVLVRAERPGGEEEVTLAEDAEAAEAAMRRYLAPARPGTRARVAPPRVLLEEYGRGIGAPFVDTLTFLALTDGVTTLPLGGARLYPRAEDGDRGPITGGMGASSPPAELDAPTAERIMDRIVNPVLRGMAAEECPYQGVLAVDLALTAAGPRVLGFTAGFPDPATHVLLPRWDDDLYVVLDAAIDTALAELAPLRWSGDATCGVVLASEGYPGEFETGYGILGLGDVGSGAMVFHNHTRDPYARPAEVLTPKIDPSRNRVSRGMGLGGWLLPSRDRSKRLDRQASSVARDPYSHVVTAGGRVLTVVGRGRTMQDARAAAYRAAEAIVFTGCRFRGDVGAGGDS